MNTVEPLSETVAELIASGQTPADVLQQVVQAVGMALAADRCFLYVRQPDRYRGRTAFCWRKNGQIPDAIQSEWQADTTNLPQEDPLFRAAITLQPSVFVDDVETATPDVLNRDFEHRTFGHRALIHAHVQKDNQLWGILQPCLFGAPRYWTAAEKKQINALLPILQPIIAAYVHLE